MRRYEELFNAMPEAVMTELNKMQKGYKAWKGQDWSRAEAIREQAYGYTNALMDAGLVNDRERGLLFLYATT